MDDSTGALRSFAEFIDGWEAADVADWLQGLDDCVLPYVHLFVNKNICGNELFILDEGDLERIGVSTVAAQQTMLLAIYQLSELCFSLDRKNLQTLAMQLGVQARNLHNELKYGLDRLQYHANASFGWLPNDVLSHVSALVENTKEIVSWLDRCPFDSLPEYATVRNTILSFASTIVQTARQRSSALTQTARDIQMACTQLYSIADNVVKEFADPLILQTAYLERVVVKRSSETEDFGINIESTANGVHIISEVKFQSPADIAGKVEAGDEIVQFCGQTVVGWPLNKLASLWNGTKSLEAQFLLKKRPQRYYGHQTLGIKVAVSRISKMHVIRPAAKAPSPTPVNGPFQFRQQSQGKPRRRSSSVSVPRTPVEKIVSNEMKSSPPASPASPTYILFPNEQGQDKNTLIPRTGVPQRRATVSGGSPTLKRLSLHLNRNISVSPRPQTQWFNDFSGVGRAVERKGDVSDLDMVLLRTKLSRPMPNHSASLIDNQLYIGGYNQTQYNVAKKRKNSRIESNLAGPRLQKHHVLEDDVFDRYILDELVAQAVEAAPSECSDAADDNLSVASNGESILVEASPNEVPPEASIDDEEWEIGPASESGTANPGTKDGKRGPAPGFTAVHKTWSFPGRDATAPRMAQDPLASLGRTSQEKLRKFFGEASVGSTTWYFSEADDTNKANLPRKSALTSSQASISSSTKSSRLPHHRLFNAIAGAAVGHNTPKKSKSILPSNGEGGSPVLTGVHRLTSAKERRGEMLAPGEEQRSAEARKVSAPTRFVDRQFPVDFDSAYSSSEADRLRLNCYLPCDSIKSPDHIGWLYRARCDFESSATKKWRKRWLVLKKELLFIYRSGEDAKAEGVLWLPAYRACPAGPEYRTSKKNVFKLFSTHSCFYFCCCHRQDMFDWLQKLGLAAIGYTAPTHSSKEAESTDHAEFYFAVLEGTVPAITVQHEPRRGHQERTDSPTFTGTKRALVQTESFLSTLRQSWRRSQLTRENSNESSLSCHSDGAASVSSGIHNVKPMKVRDPLHVRSAAPSGSERSRSAGRVEGEIKSV